MPADRLRVDEPENARRKLIPSVAPPLQGLGRAHSLIQVLEIALDSAPVSLTYDDLMGVSGLAFRTPPWPDHPSLSAGETLRALDALNEVFTPPLIVHGADCAPEPDEVMQAVASSVDAGIPCLAFGWGSVKDSWSIIAGYDVTDERLFGHCVLEAQREAYESWPPTLVYLVTIPPDLAFGPISAFLAVADRAHERWASEGRRRYRAWIAALRERDCSPDATHEAAVEFLADARGAAAAFLTRLAETHEGNRAAWLHRAAALYDRLLEALEERGAAPFSEAALMGLKDPDWRGAWATRLEEMAELEEEAATALRRSSSAEFPPEEALEP